MVGPASRKLRWLAPFDMFIERNHSCVDISTIERSVRPTKSGDCLLCIFGLVLRVCHLSRPLAAAQTQAGSDTKHSHQGLVHSVKSVLQANLKCQMRSAAAGRSGVGRHVYVTSRHTKFSILILAITNCEMTSMDWSHACEPNRIWSRYPGGILNRLFEDSDCISPIRLPMFECRCCGEIGSTDGQRR
jgi:hypothetical protein